MDISSERVKRKLILTHLQFLQMIAIECFILSLCNIMRKMKFVFVTPSCCSSICLLYLHFVVIINEVLTNEPNWLKFCIHFIHAKTFNNKNILLINLFRFWWSSELRYFRTSSRSTSSLRVRTIF